MNSLGLCRVCQDCQAHLENQENLEVRYDKVKSTICLSQYHIFTCVCTEVESVDK